MSTEIKPGTKVQIAHDPRHDWEREGPRREMNGQVGTVRTVSVPLGRYAVVVTTDGKKAEFDRGELSTLNETAKRAARTPEQDKAWGVMVAAQIAYVRACGWDHDGSGLWLAPWDKDRKAFVWDLDFAVKEQNLRFTYGDDYATRAPEKT